MGIRLVVFDVSGTTVHDGGGAVQRAMRDALATAGVTVRPGAIEGVLGMAKPQALRTILEGHGRDELLPDVPRIHDDFVRRMVAFYQNDPGVRPIDGAEAAFARLRAAGIQVALGSGFSRTVLDAVLTRVGWAPPAEVVDATLASDEVARGRPHPDMIDALRTRLGGVPYAQVAKVGDTPVDLHEGTMARCGLVVGVLTGSHRRDSLATHPHDHLIDSVADLPDLLASNRLLPD